MMGIARRNLVAPTVLVAVLAAAPLAQAGVTQCVGATGVGLCPSALSPCLVTSPVTIEPGSMIDCSGMDVRLTGSGVILVTTGKFTLLANNLTIDAGRRIEATADSVLDTGMEIDLTGSLQLAGQLVADNAGSTSTIAVSAVGSISLTGVNPAISSVGTTNSADGGEVYLVSGGDVTIGKGVFVHGTEGGDEDNVNAGGLLAITAGGNVVINEEIRAFGRWAGGGQIVVDSGGAIALNNDPGTGTPKGSIQAEGRSMSGYGGAVNLSAASRILISGPISLAGGTNNGGGEGSGGLVDLEAGCGGITIEDNVDLTGGEADGGILLAESSGPLTISSTIDARSKKLGGNGGIISLSSGQALELAATAVLNVDGHDTTVATENGRGGLVLVAGCTVNVKDTATTGAVLSAKGAAGGAMSFEGAKSPLTSAQWSVRVGDKALLDTTGSIYTGGVHLQATVLRSGYCSNNLTASCTLSSQCVFGCSAGTCQGANPETEGVNIQFRPAPATNASDDLIPCSTICN